MFQKKGWRISYLGILSFLEQIYVLRAVFISFEQTLFLLLWYFCKVILLCELQTSYFVEKLATAASRKHELTFQPYIGPDPSFGNSMVLQSISSFQQPPRTTWVISCMYSKVAHVFVFGHLVNVTLLNVTGPPLIVLPK